MAKRIPARATKEVTSPDGLFVGQTHTRLFEWKMRDEHCVAIHIPLSNMQYQNKYTYISQIHWDRDEKVTLRL